MSPTQTLEVYVKSIVNEADSINSWDLRDPSGADLPPFEAGAHIDLHLANGLVRSYSLSNAPCERHRYVVSVKNDENGRGGSQHIHETLKAGDRILITPPRNHFHLNETGHRSIFFAGGIGITPIWSMIQRLEQLEQPWELYYGAGRATACAFKAELDALEQVQPGRVHLNFRHDPGGKATDLNILMADLDRTADLYCCGPNAMLEAFEETALAHGWAAEKVHFEYFAPKQEAALGGGFTVELVRSGRVVDVQEGQSILDALLDAGVDAPFSCMQGLCGACEVAVLSGEPDHRDTVLSDSERADNAKIMICCSGCKSDKLVLDL